MVEGGKFSESEKFILEKLGISWPNDQSPHVGAHQRRDGEAEAAQHRGTEQQYETESILILRASL